jgi:hypothetical protein
MIASAYECLQSWVVFTILVASFHNTDFGEISTEIGGGFFRRFSLHNTHFFNHM